MTHEEELTFYILQEPAPLINYMGTKRWFNKDGQLHRDNDLPAVIWPDGKEEFWENGESIK